MRRSAATLFLLVACAGDDPAGPGAGKVRIEGPETLSLAWIGERALLRAVTDGPAGVRWSTTALAVARVDGGLVTAVGNGTAHIIARVDEDEDSVAVTVQQVPTGVVFFGAVEHAVRGEPFVVPVRAAVVDAGTTPVADATGTLSLALDGGGGGVLGGTMTRTVSGGVAVFDDLAIDAVGSGFRLVATRAGSPFRAESNRFDVVAAPDRIVTRNRTTSPIGLLIDGAGAAGAVNDLGRVAADSVVELVLGNGPVNEIIAFNRGRPPKLVEAGWTEGTDSIVVTFPDRIAIPMTVWIVKGPWETQRARAASAVATTALIWDEERMGLEFADVEFVDATADPDGPALYDFVLCNQQAQTVATIGKREGRINIYYVGRVDGGTDRGRACPGGDFSIMAERSGHELLAHEIGHLFGLGHVDGDERFDRTNVMHSASNTRRYLTEGQVFRSHYNGFSALRTVYGARSDQPRTCADFQGDLECPVLWRRLFADGQFVADDPASVVESWLEVTCTTGADSADVAALRALGSAAEVELRRALEDGPDPARLRAAGRAAREDARAVRARLAAGETFGMDAETRASLTRYLEDAGERAAGALDGAWRAAAARGLDLLESARR